MSEKIDMYGGEILKNTEDTAENTKHIADYMKRMLDVIEVVGLSVANAHSKPPMKRSASMGGKKPHKKGYKGGKKSHKKGHKGARSKTRRGRLDFITHKGSKVFNRRSHYQKKTAKGVKKSPY